MTLFDFFQILRGKKNIFKIYGLKQTIGICITINNSLMKDKNDILNLVQDDNILYETD